MWSKMQHLRGAIPSASVGIVAIHWATSENVSCAPPKTKKDSRVVIIGGGTAGVGVAAMLGNNGFKNVTVIEPRAMHYYQPLWTLVAGGLQPAENSEKPLHDVLTKSANWLQKAAVNVNADENTITLSDGAAVHYDYLVIGAGMVLDYSAIPGMADAINEEGSGVVSSYDFNYAQKTWREIQKFDKGRAIFTMPSTPLKCPGAPQKVMWLFEEYVRDKGIRDKTTVEYWVPGASMFGVKKYADMLTVLQKERNIEPHFQHSLISINWQDKKATFKDNVTGKTSEENYDLLHVIPAQRAPDFIRNSKLADSAGFVAVDQQTLQSTKYPNVFGIGDCTSTPNSKTAAAITSQAPILVHNLERVINGEEANAVYNGYASCPLIVGKHQVIMAEFGYGGKILETFDRDTGKFPYNLLGQEGEYRGRIFFWMKDSLFPYVYWNLWPRGMWYGSSGFFKPELELKEATKK